MGSMSYCRFENTANDLRDCLDWMNERNDPEAELQEDEAKAFRRLVKMCVEIAKDYGDV